MSLKNKTIYVPGVVSGETADEVIKNVLEVMKEIVSPREEHILRYCKRTRIRKKYFVRLNQEALIVILIRQIFDADNVSARELLHKFKRGDLSEIEFKEQFRE